MEVPTAVEVRSHREALEAVAAGLVAVGVATAAEAWVGAAEAAMVAEARVGAAGVAMVAEARVGAMEEERAAAELAEVG